MTRANALKTASSPYLRQHQDNPVWWQEWSPEALRAAVDEDIPIFVSVGYATCHWCHVMAAEAFSDPTVADAINRSFIAIKVDREERPDIDHFLMQFLLATRGQGGWPLNAFLTPDLRPMLALTYMPVAPRGGMPGFTEILDRVLEFYAANKGQLPPFTLRKRSGTDDADRDGTDGADERDHSDGDRVGRAGATPEDFEHRIANLLRRADHQAGGFGPGPKFPPHSTLLYLIFGVDRYRHEGASRILRFTLDVMARRGLHDHLQGGFFRYCVDRDWTIPHFEKMLYDQAMLLWVYARAARLFNDRHYRWVAERIIVALEETFRLPDGTYAAAHDADTDHVEGATYVWTEEELRSAGGPGVDEVFPIQPGGNFEDGLHHLTRRDDGPRDEGRDATVNEVTARLLAVRNRRRQPFRDDKVVTSWNALTGVALLEASLALDAPAPAERAVALYRALAGANRGADGRWFRSSLDGTINETEFLEDYAAVFLFETYLLEHIEAPEERAELRRSMVANEERIAAFADDGGWVSSLATDLFPVPADDFDSPTPSPVALTEMALQRSAILTGRVVPEPPLRAEMVGDFGNLAAAVAAGEWFFIEDPDPAAPEVRRSAPLHAIRVEAPSRAWCFRKVCTPGRLSSPQLL
jgi:uncharacterized protein